MTYLLIMLQVNIRELKKRLFELLKRVWANDSGLRPIGLAKGEFVVPPEFFEPLPDEVLDSFFRS